MDIYIFILKFEYIGIKSLVIFYIKFIKSMNLMKHDISHRNTQLMTKTYV